MTKKDIYRITLACFNIDIEEKIVEPDEEHPEVSKEIWFLDTHYRNAEMSCAEVYQWSFLYNFKQYTDEELYAPLSDRCHFAYPVPENCTSPVFVNNVYNANIRRIGAYFIFTEKNPALTFINDKLDFDNWIYPDAYGYLVAYKLAMETWANIAPDSKLYQPIVEKYGLTLQGLRNAEIMENRKKNPKPSIFVY